MECRDIRDHLSAYLEGDLPGAEDALVRDHLAACAVCRREAEGLRRTLAALHQLEEAPAPEGLTEDVLRKVREKKTESARSRRRVWTGLGWAWGVPVQAAAMVAVVFMALYLTRNPVHAPERDSVTMAQRELAPLREQPPEKPPEKPGGQAGSRELPAEADRIAPVPSPVKPEEEPAKEKEERENTPAAAFGTAKKKGPPKSEAPVREPLTPAEEAVPLLKKEKARQEVAPTAPSVKAAAPAPPVTAGERVRGEVEGRRDVLERFVRPGPEKDLRHEGNRLPPVASAPPTPPTPPAAPPSAVEPVREWVLKTGDLPASAARLRTALTELGGEVLEDDGQTIEARLPWTRMGRLEEILAEGGEMEGKPDRSLSGLAQRDEERSKGILSHGRQKKVQDEKQVRVKIRLIPKDGR